MLIDLRRREGDAQSDPLTRVHGLFDKDLLAGARRQKSIPTSPPHEVASPRLHQRRIEPRPRMHERLPV